MTDAAWHALGYLLAAAGLLVLLRGFVHDRSRGRRRCPKCWYAMDGVPESQAGGSAAWVCPECGNAARSVRALHRTRRRARMLPLTGVLLVIGYAVWCVPRAATEGAKGFIPTLGLMAAVPYPEPDYLAKRPGWYFELQGVLRRRAESDQVWAWQAAPWDWRLRLRFALEGRAGVPGGVHAAVATLDSAVIGAFTANDLDDLRSRVRESASMTLSAPDGPLIWPVPGPLPASRTLDFVCNDMRFRGVRWTAHGSAVELLPRGAPPPTYLCTYRCPGLNVNEVADAVLGLVAPEDWFINGGTVSTIDAAGDRLFVVAPAVEQVRIGALVEGLLRADGEPVSVPPRMPAGPYSDDMPRRMLAEVVVYDVSGLDDIGLDIFGPRTTPARRVADSLMGRSGDWVRNGGDAASVHVVRSLLVVSAPPDVQALVRDRLAGMRR